MVNLIARIIEAALASGRDLYLPDTGTLVVRRSAAVRKSRKSIIPPQRTVTFTEKECGVSLADEIARAAGIGQEQARALCKEWRAQAEVGGVLTIDGVGEIKDGRFTATDAFDAALNPQGHEPIAIKPRRDSGLYIFAALCCIFALGTAWYVWNLNGGKETASHAADISPAAADEPVVQTVETETPQEISEPEAAAAPEPARQSLDDELVRTSQGCSYVVLGIFSTKENAFRAAEQAESRYDVRTRVYLYADKYLVSLYESPERAECTQYMKSASERFSDLWIYTKQ